MSLGLAIAAATGLDPERDFEVRDDGDGAYLARWNTKERAEPTDAELTQWLSDYESGAKEREKDRVLRARALDYLVAIMYKDELADTSKLTSVQSDIATDVAKVDVDDTGPIDPPIVVTP